MQCMLCKFEEIFLLYGHIKYAVPNLSGKRILGEKTHAKTLSHKKMGLVALCAGFNNLLTKKGL